MRLFLTRLSRGAGWVPVLLLLAVLLIAAPIVIWMLGAALSLIWMAIRICGALLVLLVILYFIMKMAKKVNS